jgi:hypothetical protein
MPPTADFRTPDALAKQSFDLLQLQLHAAYRIMAVPKDARAIRFSKLCKRRRGRRQVTHISRSRRFSSFSQLRLEHESQG